MSVCNNNCYWNMDGYCVSEDAETVYDDQSFQTEKCVGFLREDMEEHMNKIKHYILNHIRDLSYKDTIKVYDMINSSEI